MYVYKYVVIVWVNGSSPVAKILKNHRYLIEYFLSKCLSYVFLLFELEVQFHGQYFGIVFYIRIYHKRWEKEPTLPLPSARKSEICYRIAIQRMLGIITLIYIFNVKNFSMWIFRKQWELEKNAQVWLYRGCYSPSNSIMTNVVLRDIDPHCQCGTFYCDAFVLKKKSTGRRCSL